MIKYYNIYNAIYIYNIMYIYISYVYIYIVFNTVYQTIPCDLYMYLTQYTRQFPVTLFVFSAKWPLERGQLRKT